MDWQQRLLEEFLPAILHGDEEHRQWLTDAFHAFVNGQRIPPVRPPMNQGGE